jgi:hypothetical protein
MSDRFTAQEWEIVAGLPAQAATAAAVANGVAVFGTLRELNEGETAIAEGATDYPGNALIAAILAEMTESAAEAEAQLRMVDEGGPLPDEPAVDELPDQLAEPEADTSPEVADEIAETAAPGDAVVAIEAPEVDPRDPLAYVHEVIANAMQAREILAAKASPDEAGEYVAWVLGAVERVINRTKSGGFLGIGGQRVDADEARFRADLTAALGGTAPSE